MEREKAIRATDVRFTHMESTPGHANAGNGTVSKFECKGMCVTLQGSR